VFNIIAYAKMIFDDDDYASYSFSIAEIIFSWIAVCLMLKTKSLRLKRLEQAECPLNRSSEHVLLRQTEEG